MKILIIDDEEQIAKALERILIMLGHETDYCFSAKDGVEKLKNDKFDFVLVDYLMPEYTGVWFMKNADVPHETKVLLITAYVNRQVIAEMFKYGACGYLIKPFDEDEIKMHLAFHSTPHPV